MTTRAGRLPLVPGLRMALVLAMLPVLLLPVLGLWFVGEMAQITRNERRETLNAAARNYAAALSERGDLLGDGAAGRVLPPDTAPLALEVLARAEVDGRADEWIGAARYGLSTRAASDAPVSTLSVQVAVARSQEQTAQLFLLVEVGDERYVAPDQDPVNGQPRAGDQLEILAGPTPDALVPIEGRIHAGGHGWDVEAALPVQSRFLRITASDVDYQASRRLEATARSPLFALTSPALANDGAQGLRAAELEARWSAALRGFDQAGLRVSVHDAQGSLLARLGELNLRQPERQGWLASLAGRLLTFAVGLSGDFNAVDQNLSPLSAALTGLPLQQSLRVVAGAGSAFWLTTSAHPIWFDARVAGALVLEQGNGSDLAASEEALQWLALLAAAAIVVTALALFALTGLTTRRITRLRDAADAAIDPRGRVVAAIPRFGWQDEVGSLALGYNRVLDRLREHQHYLANLRARLVHELRTPIMVVRSSLENLVEGEHDGGRRDAFVERALGGTVRLERIVASMSEAASLESMLADSQLEQVDLVGMMGGLVQAYDAVYAKSPGPPRFMLESPPSPVHAMVVPETIAQAIDKLVANAVDFATPGSAIVLELANPRDGRRESGDAARTLAIAVRNQGRALPDQMSESLFESMVSVREPGARDQSHLGLGLYLVRLIAEFHGGHAFAENVEGGVRVGFIIRAGTDPDSSPPSARTLP